jgi:uncharacterized membrane protein
MAGRASIAGHPIHPMLVPIPIGLWIFSFVGDLVVRFGSGSDAWATVAYYCIAGGIIGALLAAVFGLIDLFSLTDPAVKKIGITHMVINLVIVTLYAVNLGIRYQTGDSQGAPFDLSVVCILLLLASGWLGGHMVYIHGVAVGKPAEAPRPATEADLRQHRPAGGH